MKLINISNSGKLMLAFAGVSLMMAAGAKADCVTNGGPSKRTAPIAWSGGHANRSVFRLVADQHDSPSAFGGSIVGLWNATFTSGGMTVDQGFDAWNSDGTEILNDDPPPAAGNICLGVWVKSGPNTYKVKHPSWTYDPVSGMANGTAIIRETITVAPNGNTYHGTFTIDFFDLSNNPQGSFNGTVAATRITVDF